MTPAGEAIRNLVAAVESGRPDRLREVLSRDPGLRGEIDGPHFAFDAPAVVAAKRDLPLLDVLLEHGADINARSRWWAGGFGVLDFVASSEEGERLAEALIGRGAQVGVHAAAGLGRLERLRELIAADPKLVYARGGDGQTPLHFARTVEAAKLLLDRGADIDARDVDHESTPAQWRVADRPEVVRFLVERGCRTDLLLASALGDLELVRRHVEADQGWSSLRVDQEHFPMTGPRAGGHIYNWTLGSHLSSHQVARKFGRTEIHRYLMERSPPLVQLLERCWEGDGGAVERLLEKHPRAAEGLQPAQKSLLAHAARNELTEAVKLFLRLGLPVDALGQHRATALHWAAFHGNAEMAREILRHAPSLELADGDHGSTPLGWAAYGSRHGWRASSGDYTATATALLAAGARLRESMLEVAAEPVARVLRQALTAG